MQRRAFTFVEMMMVVILMAIIAVVVLPNSTADGTVRLVGAVNIVVADIEYAQSLSLAEPGDAALLRFDEILGRYWIALSSDPTTPIARANGDPYVVTFGAAGGVDLIGIVVDLENEMNDLQYDAFGRLSMLGQRTIRLTSATSGTMRIVITAETGSVFIEPDGG
ncbi:prepilin-type N-terminal cleavage/methylation domain-containing protein [Planctomycetaceae bacterium AH-315-I19]|nr:prepilin-type N-terminal cleavage/methylation domain-containing protein [Planctomycetaceae bacterium AH-315-I19]